MERIPYIIKFPLAKDFSRNYRLKENISHMTNVNTLIIKNDKKIANNPTETLAKSINTNSLQSSRAIKVDNSHREGGFSLLVVREIQFKQ